MEVIRVGVNEGLEEEAKKAAIVGAGMAAGFGISEFTSEYVVKSAKATGDKAMILKIATRIGFVLVFSVLSFMTGGVLSIVLFGAAAGAMGGVFYDVVSHYVLKGTPSSVAERMAVSNVVGEIVSELNSGEGESRSIEVEEYT